MSRRTVGIGLIAVAALVYSARVIATAIMTAKISNIDARIFSNFFEFTDQGTSLLIGLAVITGIAFLVWAEVAEKRK